MIKFFRQIRQNLLSEGKTIKYFKYAIGEIILVIIGILFALQINNWNSDKKAHHQELDLYVKLLNDLNDNFNNTVNKKSIMKRIQNVHYQVYNESMGKTGYDPTTNYHHLQWAQSYSADISEKYTDLLSSISNDSIRDLLKNYVQLENKVTESFTRWNKLKAERLYPFLNKYGLHDTEATFNDHPYDYAPLFYIDVIDYSKLKEHYGSVELDEILFDLRVGTSWCYSNLKWLERSNNRFEEVLVSLLRENGRKESIKRIPRKHLSDLLTEGKTIGELIQFIKIENNKDSEYITESWAINALAYDLFRKENLNDALKLFKLNTEIYPEKSNPWDSYSMCLIAMGEKEEGIAAYRKFVELSPLNQNAKRKLDDLERTE
jgi:tetratricopeptide (TPR) repeat protein